jgi:hypothetical protein
MNSHSQYDGTNFDAEFMFPLKNTNKFWNSVSNEIGHYLAVDENAQSNDAASMHQLYLFLSRKATLKTLIEQGKTPDGKDPPENEEDNNQLMPAALALE